MKHIPWLLFALGAAVSCSGNDDEPTPEAGETGSLRLALSDVPKDALCLEVTFAGHRETDVKLDLEPASEASFELKRLPAGVVTIDAAAYPAACDEVPSTAEPSYVLESPVTARIRSQRVTDVFLKLVGAGRVALEVEFESADAGEGPMELALIGDTPYGTQQVLDFPLLSSAINADAEIDKVVHVGDIKNGSSLCDDEYFSLLFGYLNDFTAPLIYTPGDNEWTDCHRENNGAYDPLERLEAIRAVFFANPGETLGKEPTQLLSQAAIPAHAAFVENVLWAESQVVFATVHVVGSANGYAPWFGTDMTGTKFDDPDRRIAEVEARIAAALDWTDRAFDLAESSDAKGLALFMQADTFIGGTEGFEAIISLLAERAAAFAKPVLLVQGDSHVYVVDQPLVEGNQGYGITTEVPNLTRLVVQGSTIGEWVKLRVDPDTEEVFSWTREFVSL